MYVFDTLQKVNTPISFRQILPNPQMCYKKVHSGTEVPYFLSYFLPHAFSREKILRGPFEK